MISWQFFKTNTFCPVCFSDFVIVNNSGVGPMDVQDDEYVAKSPGSSPKKKVPSCSPNHVLRVLQVKTSNFSLSRVLGGRDLVCTTAYFLL